MFQPQYMEDDGETLTISGTGDNSLLLIGGVMNSPEYRSRLIEKGVYHDFSELFPEFHTCGFKRVVNCTDCGIQAHLPDRAITEMYKARQQGREIRINCIFCAARSLRDQPHALLWYLMRLHPCLARIIND